MDLHQRTIRVGLLSILCALVFRICSMDPALLFRQILQNQDLLAFVIYLETGRDVRFSPSLGNFSPAFVETPPPATEPAQEPCIPAFSDPDSVRIHYLAGADPDIGALLEKPLNWDLYSPEPTVLILHTHGTESYTRQGESYRETAAFRTLDEGYNMLSIGQEVVRLLNERGITAIQDRQLHDYPSYNGSYSHARSSIAALLEENPGIRLILDLHRDASDGETGQLRTLAHTDKGSSAQLMVVLGTSHKYYEDNLSFGLKLHAQLEQQSPGITRPLQLRSGRFNQDLLPGAVLVEVGAAGNTRQEALLAARQLADAVVALARGTRSPSETVE